MTSDPLQPGTTASPTTAVHAAPPPVVAPPSSRGGGWLNILLFGALALAVGGVAFAVGRTTAPAATFAAGNLPGGLVITPDGSFDPNTAGGPNGAPQGFALGGGLTIDGTVTAIDGDELTLTLADGRTMVITLDDTTTYHAATDATAADVGVGDDVSVKVDADRGAFGRGPGASAAPPSTSAEDVTVRQ